MGDSDDDDSSKDSEDQDSNIEGNGGKQFARQFLDDESIAKQDSEDGEGDGEEDGEEDGDAIGDTEIFEISDQYFEELKLPRGQLGEIQATWAAFLRSTSSREVAGEAIYAAIFEAAPSLQSLFKTPRAVMAMRLISGLHNIVNSLKDPKALKVAVETLGFQHLEMEVTAARVALFRDAIADLLTVELGSRMTTLARNGWASILNYTGGAFIFIRLKYTERLKIIASSWATANNRKSSETSEEEKENNTDETMDSVGEPGTEHEKQIEKAMKAESEASDNNSNNNNSNNSNNNNSNNRTPEGNGRAGMFGRKSGKAGPGEVITEEKGDKVNVPRTFNEMFTFNSAVMGFKESTWLNEVLASFDTIVTSTTNSSRLQEECDLISLRIANFKGIIVLDQFKAVMLASLRSLVPKEWNSAHEVAWGWLWENVERMIKVHMGKPIQHMRALTKLWSGMEEAQQVYLRKEFYSRFFALAPAGQDYFKQSTTRQFLIADKITKMTLEIYRDPKKMVQDISALGLRHVGYGIPTELFGPFVTACVQVVRELTDDDMAEEAFRWSASLISRILVRVIAEGSTIVMKAINVNSGHQLQRAVACAPRGKRALWMLNVQVGTQSISPLVWAVETGALDAARAMLDDLLTIRADRDQYYYGAKLLFVRHPDIIKRLCADAPALLPTLLDGLIWRSRLTERGRRRVNYYFKDLLLDAEGGLAKNVEWFTEYRDPRLVCHPIVAHLTDLLWSRVASRIFVVRKFWLLATLVIFAFGHALLPNLKGLEGSEEGAEGAEGDPGDGLGGRILIFACRMIVYFFSMGQLIFSHTRNFCGEVAHRRFVMLGPIPIPEYLANWQESTSFALVLVLFAMCCTEPIFYCMEASEVLLSDRCALGEKLHYTYSIFSMIGMALYFALCVNLTVFSNKVSAYVLLCGRVLSEVLLFILAWGFFVVTFACSVTALEGHNPGYETIDKGIQSLVEITLGMLGEAHFQSIASEPVLLVAIGCYLFCTVVFLLNLLIAQLNCSYTSTFQDMVGYARLNRGKIVVESMVGCSEKRWASFVESLNLGDQLEFSEGDFGLAGGVQMWEPAAANPTTEDLVRRYGGSTSASMPWPEEAQAGGDEDRLERIEKMIQKAMKKMSHGKSGGGGQGPSSRGASSVGQSSGMHSRSDGSEDEDA